MGGFAVAAPASSWACCIRAPRHPSVLLPRAGPADANYMHFVGEINQQLNFAQFELRRAKYPVRMCPAVARRTLLGARAALPLLFSGDLHTCTVCGCRRLTASSTSASSTGRATRPASAPSSTVAPRTASPTRASLPTFARWWGKPFVSSAPAQGPLPMLEAWKFTLCEAGAAHCRSQPFSHAACFLPPPPLYCHSES